MTINPLDTSMTTSLAAQLMRREREIFGNYTPPYRIPQREVWWRRVCVGRIVVVKKHGKDMVIL